MRKTPKLKSIIKNDTGAFMCAWLPVFFATIAVGLFIYSESTRDNYTVLEILYLSPIIFISLSACLWPFIIWWWYSIYIAFKNGTIIEATISHNKIKNSFDLGVIYTFEYQGKKFEHIASLIPNKTTKEIATMQSFDIVFNPVNNLSFIKNVYI